MDPEKEADRKLAETLAAKLRDLTKQADAVQTELLALGYHTEFERLFHRSAGAAGTVTTVYTAVSVTYQERI